MPDVQLSHGYVRIANALQTALALAPWDSAAQRRLVDALIRVTYGFRRKDAPIGTAEWRALTGLSVDQVKRGRKVLQEQGVIVLVEAFDATTSTPNTWALQKDYTKWGRFAVSQVDVTAAEEVAAGTPAPSVDESPQGAQTPPGGTDAPRGRGSPQGAHTPPPQGAPAHPPPGARMPPGAGAKSLQEDGVTEPKDSGKTGKTYDTTTQPRGRAADLEGLTDFLGGDEVAAGAVEAMATSNASHPETWAGNILALYGHRPGDELVYRGVAESDRPPILRVTVLRYAGTAQAYQGNFFRRILQTVIEEHGAGKLNLNGDGKPNDRRPVGGHRGRAATQRQAAPARSLAVGRVTFSSDE
jgi:hypothetical protein